MDEYQLPSELLVLEKDIEKNFFAHYRKMADLMTVDSFIDESQWDVYKGPLGKVIAWATFNDPEFKEYKDKYGYKFYLECLYEELLLNKLGMEPSDQDIREKLLSYFDGAMKEVKVRTGDYFVSYVNTAQKLFVVASDLTLESLAHEAGHVLFEEKNKVSGNRMSHKGVAIDSEVFALYSSDIALRPLQLEIVKLLNNDEMLYALDFTSPGHKMAFSLYEEIAKTNGNDISRITGHMKEYFHGDRSLL